MNQECSGSESSCVISGLTAGQPYVFVVTARNSVGVSAPSAPSAAIVPDATPSVPAAPSVQYVDRGRLSVSWVVPTGEFTPVTGMSIQVVQNGSVVQVLDNVRSPLLFEGLDQGSSYQFQVRAVNQQGISDLLGAQCRQHPLGCAVGPPTDLRASFVYDTGRRRLDVSWGAPADTGGEPVLDYRVFVDGQDVGVVTGTAILPGRWLRRQPTDPGPGQRPHQPGQWAEGGSGLGRVLQPAESGHRAGGFAGAELADRDLEPGRPRPAARSIITTIS